ncbi:MAG: YbhB/YbcL family Raf kinase inhibitor-like protein [Methanoregula sp.]
MEKRWLLIPALFTFFVVLAAGCTAPSGQAPVMSPQLSPPPGSPAGIQTQISPVSPGFTLQVDSLVPESVLPDVYTCNGSGISPELAWKNTPAGTKCLVLILDDPDAPSGTFTHWILYNIPPSSTGMSPGQPNEKVLPDNSQQGRNTAGSRGYYPPCPPSGSTHNYVFSLYAVDMDIIQPTADRESIDIALNGHTLAKAQVRTRFKR